MGGLLSHDVGHVLQDVRVTIVSLCLLRHLYDVSAYGTGIIMVDESVFVHPKLRN